MYHFIINPASKSGKGQKIWERVKFVMKERNVEYKEYFTKKAGDATNFVRELTSDLKGEKIHIVALGGDGTINEVVNGIMDFENTIISYISTGSSNDLARDMRLSPDPAKAIKVIMDDPTMVQMDIGELQYEVKGKHSDIYTDNEVVTRRFAVSSDVGFGASVCDIAQRSRIKKVFNKVGLGKLTYIGIAISQLMGGQKIKCKVMLDEDRQIELDRFLMVATMIHKYEGGGVKFCPKADYKDGMLDVCVVGNIPRAKVLFVFPTAYAGKHLRFKNIDAYRTSTIEVCLEEPVWIHTDGEAYSQTTHMKIRTLPEKVNFCY